MSNKVQQLLELPRRKPNQIILMIATVVFVFMTGFSMYFSSITTTKPNETKQINALQEKTITLNIDGFQTEKTTNKKTVAEVLNGEGIQTFPYDEIKPSRTARIKDNMVIFVRFAQPLVINDGGIQKTVMTVPQTVAAILGKNHIAVDNDDKVRPALTSVVDAHTKILITRVEKLKQTKDVPVAFATVKKKDSSMTAGKTVILQRGQKGLSQNTYWVTKENGKVVSKSLIIAKKIVEPKSQIVKVGTKQNSLQPFAGGKTYTVTATAYTIGPENGGNYTATGFNLAKNLDAKVIAVDPRVIPLGSKVYVEGYGYARAIDVGGAIKGRKIDVFMASKSKVNSWGVRTVQIRVLT